MFEFAHSTIRLRPLTAALAATTMAASPQVLADPAERPNIIFILADDLGPDGFGCYGSELFSNSTPRIDALATNGMRFTRAYCSAICSPTRAQYLTGQYPFRNGVLDIDGSCDRLNTNKPILTKVLVDAGYTTGGAGKSVTDSGWSYLTGENEWATFNFMEEYLQAGTGSYWEYKPYNYAFNSPTSVDPHGYDYIPDALHAFALDFIDRHYPRADNQFKPFYFYYSLINPHTDIEPTPDSEPGETDLNALYKDNIEYIDKVIGEIVDRLTAHGVLDSTLLIISGDNGSLGNYQSKLWDPASSTYRSIDGGKADRVHNREGTALVPFIVHWPEVITTPSVEDDLVDFTDLLPTYADVAGGTIPTNWVLDGQSIAPLLRGGTGWTPRDWIYHQIENNWCVRGTDYRLNRDGRLFDMSDAPFSMTEILLGNDTSESAAARVALQTVLDDLDPINGPTYEAHQDNQWNNPAWDWKHAQFGGAKQWITAISGDLSDPDGDGVLNVFERAFGWNPNAGTNTLPKPILKEGSLEVTYPAALSNSDVRITVDVTNSLTNIWDSSSEAIETTGGNPLTQRDRVNGPARFMRFRAERITPWNEP